MSPPFAPSPRLRLAAASLRDQGDALATQGETEQAITQYQKAKAWDPTLQFDPRRRAQAQAAAAEISR